MSTVIDSVADLTDLRDKDELEITLATVMFEAVEASTLLLWRLIRRDGEIRLRERVRLPSANNAKTLHDPLVDLTDLPRLEWRAELRACYDAKLYLRRPPDEKGMRSHIFPVSDGRDVICILEILRPSQLRDDEERLVFGLLRIYSNHLGILNDSDRDELTGLLNRRSFDESFKRIASASPKTNAIIPAERRRPNGDVIQAQLAVVDIDFFKRVNDRFGHPYGDEVLGLLSRLMVQSFRDADRLFRFGGEEFLLILTDTDLPEAELALERFRATVEMFEFPQVGRITVSIGFTSLLAGDTGSNAFGRADEALYIAKRQGRNQVRCHELLISDGVLMPKMASDQAIEFF